MWGAVSVCVDGLGDGLSVVGEGGESVAVGGGLRDGIDGFCSGVCGGDLRLCDGGGLSDDGVMGQNDGLGECDWVS